MSDTRSSGSASAAIFSVWRSAIAAARVVAAVRTGVARSLGVIDQMPPAPRSSRSPQSPGVRWSSRSPSDAGAGGATLAVRGRGRRLQRRLDIAGNPRGMTPDRMLATKGLGLVAGLAWACCSGSARAARPARAGRLGFGARRLLPARRPPLQHRPEAAGGDPQQPADALDMLTSASRPGSASTPALAQVARNTDGPDRRRVRPRAAGDADRQEPGAAFSGPGARGPRSPELQDLRLGAGAGRQARHPGRRGAARAVHRDAAQAAAAGRGEGARRCRSRSSSRCCCASSRPVHRHHRPRRHPDRARVLGADCDRCRRAGWHELRAAQPGVPVDWGRVGTGPGLLPAPRAERG